MSNLLTGYVIYKWPAQFTVQLLLWRMQETRWGRCGCQGISSHKVLLTSPAKNWPRASVHQWRQRVRRVVRWSRRRYMDLTQPAFPSLCMSGQTYHESRTFCIQTAPTIQTIETPPQRGMAVRSASSVVEGPITRHAALDQRLLSAGMQAYHRTTESGSSRLSVFNLFTTIHDGNFRRHSSMNVTIKWHKFSSNIYYIYVFFVIWSWKLR